MSKANVPSFEADQFSPIPSASNPHVQTIGGHLFRNTTVEYERERLTTPDGDFLDLDFGLNSHGQIPQNDRVVLLLHGLEGCSLSGYIREACQWFIRQNFTPVAMNFRSCSGTVNRKPRSYHSGDTRDVRFVIDWIRDRFSNCRLGVMGFSLGGNVVLKLLGELGGRARNLIEAAVGVSVPFDLSAGADHLNDGMGYLYSLYFLPSMIRKLIEKERKFRHGLELNKILYTWSLRRFDDHFTAPIHGFRSAEHYYRESSSKKYVGEIRCPTLLIHSRDDPLIPFSSVPINPINENPWMQSVITDRGGHVGFMGGTSFSNSDFWSERTAARFLDQVI